MRSSISQRCQDIHRYFVTWILCSERIYPRLWNFRFHGRGVLVYVQRVLLLKARRSFCDMISQLSDHLLKRWFCFNSILGREKSMKKTLLLAGVAGLFASNVCAAEIKPYVGLDYVYSSIDYEESAADSFLEDNLNSIAVNAGTRLNKNFGIEAFYQQSEEADKKVFGVYESEVKFKAYGVDLMGYLPLDSQLELLGTVGIAQYDADVKEKIPSMGISDSSSEDGLGARIGAGVQYNINEQVAVRAIGQYVFTDIDGVDNLTEFSAGIQYRF